MKLCITQQSNDSNELGSIKFVNSLRQTKWIAQKYEGLYSVYLELQICFIDYLIAWKTQYISNILRIYKKFPTQHLQYCPTIFGERCRLGLRYTTTPGWARVKSIKSFSMKSLQQNYQVNRHKPHISCGNSFPITYWNTQLYRTNSGFGQIYHKCRPHIWHICPHQYALDRDLQCLTPVSISKK